MVRPVRASTCPPLYFCIPLQRELRYPYQPRHVPLAPRSAAIVSNFIKNKLHVKPTTCNLLQCAHHGAKNYDWLRYDELLNPPITTVPSYKTTLPPWYPTANILSPYIRIPTYPNNSLANIIHQFLLKPPQANFLNNKSNTTVLRIYYFRINYNKIGFTRVFMFKEVFIQLNDIRWDLCRIV